MVKLIWDNKSNKLDRLGDKRKEYLNYYKIFESTGTKLDDSWRNMVFWGDNIATCYYLLENFGDTIDLIYVDPPFFSGVNYGIKIIENDSVYDSIAYFDRWNKDLDSYLQMLYQRLLLFHKLLSKNGLLFIHLDFHAYHYIKIILDEIFGRNRFVNDIIWYYYNKYSAGKSNLPRAHDNILVYSKSSKYTFNQLRLPRDNPRKQLKREMIDGILKNVKDEDGHVVYQIVNDKKLDDVWRIPCLQPASKEWTGFPTQKHNQLIRRIIQIGSNKGDLIADLFCGSGTTLVEAEKLNRRWIGGDISKYSMYISKKRILKEFNDNSYPVDFYTHKENQDIIDSGFFNKNLEIKRRK